MELHGRHIWLPVKVVHPKPFTPCNVIYKPSRKGTHKNVLYKIPNSEGKCYEFAFVRSFSRFEAHKYVCSGCRVLKMQNQMVFRQNKLPYVQVSKDQFLVDPSFPENGGHFCRPKIFVDVLQSGAMSALKCQELPEREIEGKGSSDPPTSSESLDCEGLPADRRSPISIIINEHNYASTSGEGPNDPRGGQFLHFPIYSADPVYRIPSNGTKRIIFMLPYAREHCYEFYQRKSRSVYFDVYACAGCNRMKEHLGSAVGPVPTVQVRGEYYMTDPQRPRHRHYCKPKLTCEQVVQGEIVRVMQDSSGGSITTVDAVLKAVAKNLSDEDGCDSVPGTSDYLKTLAHDKAKVASMERRYSLNKPAWNGKTLKVDASTSPAQGSVVEEKPELTLSQKDALEKKAKAALEQGTEGPRSPQPPSVFFGLQRKLLVSKLPSDLKRRPTSNPVLYPVKVLKVEESVPPPPQPRLQKDEEFVDVEGC